MPLETETILLEKYRILRLIGRGGMARVWLAEETAFGRRQVAIKEPLSANQDDGEIARRFAQEVTICVALEEARAPNIVRAYTVEQWEGHPLLVMEYLPGQDLAAILAQSPGGLPVTQAVTIASQVLAALAVAHDHAWEIVHRDIKPANILFDAAGTARLADFGLAQLAGLSQRSRLQGQPHPGTPAYMPPEQATSTQALTPAADVYAVGAVLFELLTGRRYNRVQPGTSVRMLRAEVSPALSAVVSKALEREPYARYQTADAMAGALAAATTAAGRSGRPAGRGRNGMWLLLGSALLALLFAGWFVWSAASDSTVAPAPTQTATPTNMLTFAPPLPGSDDASAAPGVTMPSQVIATPLPISPEIVVQDQVLEAVSTGFSPAELLAYDWVDPDHTDKRAWRKYRLFVDRVITPEDAWLAVLSDFSPHTLGWVRVPADATGRPRSVSVDVAIPDAAPLTQLSLQLFRNNGPDPDRYERGNIDEPFAEGEAHTDVRVALPPSSPFTVTPTPLPTHTDTPPPTHTTTPTPNATATAATGATQVALAVHAALTASAPTVTPTPTPTGAGATPTTTATTTPTPDATATAAMGATQVALAVHATLTASAPTPTPTPTFTPPPTATRTPNATATARANVTALARAVAATLTASAPTPTPSPTSSPTPSPTPPPSATLTPNAAATSRAAGTALARSLRATLTAAAPTPTPTPTPTPPATPTPAIPPTPTAPPPPAAGDVRELGGIRFVYVPAGEFRMGSSDAEVQRAVELCRSYPDDGGGDCATKFEDERPTRTVYLDAFWVMQTELTNAHFAPFVNGGGYQDPQYWSADGWNWRQSEGITQPGYWNDARLNAPQQPVVGLSWFEAEAYTNWLRQQTGRPVRLPTEEEWEKAARGTDGRLFPWGNDWNGANTNFCDRACTLYAWADPNVDDGFAFTAPVGAYRSGASPYGVLDMAGNVWEWVANRARRGGSWTNDPEGVRTTERLYDDRYTRANVLEFPSKAGTGFRLVVSDDF